MPSENDFNILRFWKETLQQYRFLYDIQQRNVEDHSNVILSLMARSLLDGAASSLTLAIGPTTRNRAGVLTSKGRFDVILDWFFVFDFVIILGALG